MRKAVTAMQVVITATALLVAEVARTQRARRRADVWSGLSDKL